MANSCCFEMVVCGDSKDIKKFLKLFIYDDGVENENEYFARTFLESYKNHKEYIKEKREEIKLGKIYIGGWCAWSLWSCLISGYPNKKELTTLSDACKKYKVIVEATSKEEGMGFKEEIGCSKIGYLDYEETDLI